MILSLIAKFIFVFMCVFSSFSAKVHGEGLAEGQRKILFLGDSLTAAYGVDLSYSYPSLIQETLNHNGYNYEVINAGVSGDTTAGGLRRINWLLRQKLDIVVIALGANDGLRGIDPSITKDNLTKIIDKVLENPSSKSSDTKILLIGMLAPPNMGSEYEDRFNHVFSDLAKEKGVAFFPFLLEGVVAEPKFNLPDGIHPNEEGYKKIALNVWMHLEPLLER